MSGVEDQLLEELRRYVETLEAARHARGWDEPARLYRIHRGGDGALDSDEIRLDLFCEDPVVSVQLLASSFERAHELPSGMPAVIGSFLATEPTIVYASVHEAWAHEYSPEEGARARSDPDTPPLADVPGSYEVRFAVAVLDATVLSYFRRRGQDPRWADDRPVTDEVLEYERLTAAVVRLTRADRAMAGRAVSN